MPPLALTDSELEMVSTMAAPLPPSQRAAFLQALADALARYAAEVRGPGLVHRVGRDVQYGFVKGRLVRAGGTVESRGGLSPPRAPRTVHEPLDSHGSRCSAVAIT